MHPSFIPPRHVTIGDAASFAGTTPRAVRHYHELGLLPEPERGGDDRRRYGYEDMIRLLWIRRMADAGIALDDIRDAWPDPAPTHAGADADGVAALLERVEAELLARETELRRQRTAVQRMRARGSRAGLLSDLVADRLADLPEGSLRQADLDDLLVVERILGPLGAAIRASRHIALATHPALRRESDRVDAAEEALDSTVAVDDPRVAQVAAERHAVEVALNAVIEESGLAEEEDELVTAWDARHPAADRDDAGAGWEGGEAGAGEAAVGPGPGRRRGPSNLAEAAGKVPYDLSPARLRCLQLVEELAAGRPPAV